MNNDRLIWFGRYEGWLRHIAHGVKDGDVECLEKAGQLFDLMLPNECVVVPMPSHIGRATTMHTIAHAVCHGGRRRIMCDALECDPHESSYDQKKAGRLPSPVDMRIADWARGDFDRARAEAQGGVYIIDNVVCTGMTARSALLAMEHAGIGAMVCALALSTWR